MNARLIVTRGEGKGKEFVLEPGDNIVGRWDPDAGAFPEIDLDQYDPEAQVSRSHAVIHLTSTQVTIEDLGSLNGSFINRGARLVPNKKQALKDGDEIVIGKTFLKLTIE